MKVELNERQALIPAEVGKLKHPKSKLLDKKKFDQTSEQLCFTIQNQNSDIKKCDQTFEK